jgi:DNA-binding NarL/FixJ family response regulator
MHIMLSKINPTPRTTNQTRLLIVDDVDRVREELRHWLDLVDEVQVVGEAPDGRTAIRQAEALHPEVVLMDLELPGLDGWQATREIKARRLAKRIIVLTIHGDPESKQRALRAGADAVLSKGIDFKQLLEFITNQTTSEDRKEAI